MPLNEEALTALDSTRVETATKGRTAEVAENVVNEIVAMASEKAIEASRNLGETIRANPGEFTKGVKDMVSNDDFLSFLYPELAS